MGYTPSIIIPTFILPFRLGLAFLAFPLSSARSFWCTSLTLLTALAVPAPTRMSPIPSWPSTFTVTRLVRCLLIGVAATGTASSSGFSSIGGESGGSAPSLRCISRQLGARSSLDGESKGTGTIEGVAVSAAVAVTAATGSAFTSVFTPFGADAAARADSAALVLDFWVFDLPIITIGSATNAEMQGGSSLKPLKIKRLGSNSATASASSRNSFYCNHLGQAAGSVKHEPKTCMYHNCKPLDTSNLCHSQQWLKHIKHYVTIEAETSTLSWYLWFAHFAGKQIKRDDHFWTIQSCPTLFFIDNNGVRVVSISAVRLSRTLRSSCGS